MKTFTLALLYSVTWFSLLSPANALESDEPLLQRVQIIELNKGWNAVYWEVAPLESEPDRVFANLPVDMAATFFPGSTSSEQFITNPGINLTKSRGWGVWFAKDRPEAFLGSLGAIYGQQAYLVHAKSAIQWNLTGTVVPSVTRWRSDAYNLVGFGVRSQGAPSFAEFFDGSAAHRQQSIYRLVNDNWKKVTQADAESMRSGEAFWIYCKGSSDFQGPLRVELPLSGGLMLSGDPGAVILRNQTGNPLTATFERVASGGNELPVSMVMTMYGDPANPVKSVTVAKPTAPWTQELPALEAGKAFAVPFESRSAEMTSSAQGALLKVTTDLGSEYWVPVYGFRPDLSK